MKQSTIFVVITAAFWSGLLSFSFAAQDLESYVPEGYDITIRVCVHKALTDPVLEPMRNILLPPQATTSFDVLTTLTGVNLRTDVDSAVVAAYIDKTRKNEGMILIRGRFDKNRIVGFLKNTEKYEETPAGNLTIHGFWSQKEGEMRYAAFLANDVLTVGQRPVVERAVSGVNAKGAKRLIDNPLYASRLAAIPAETVVAVVGIFPAQLAAEDPRGEALKKSIKAVRIFLSADQSIHATAELAMADEESAKLGQQVIQGGIALIQMVDKISPLAETCRGAHLSSQGTDISLTADMTIPAFTELVAKGRRNGMVK